MEVANSLGDLHAIYKARPHLTSQALINRTEGDY